MRDPFAGVELLGEARAGAVPERIAGGEHDRRPAAAAQHDLRIERHRPGTAATDRPRPAPDDARRRRPFRPSASAFRLASDSPARPSSPIPMMVSQGSAMTRALILGGTTDANRLAAEIARAGIDAIYSYGGRTRAPAVSRCRPASAALAASAGLPTTSASEAITHVIDATHPFAAEMSRNAIAACAETGTPLIALERAPWTKTPGDNWIEVADVAAAVAALPEAPAQCLPCHRPPAHRAFRGQAAARLHAAICRSARSAAAASPTPT